MLLHIVEAISRRRLAITRNKAIVARTISDENNPIATNLR